MPSVVQTQTITSSGYMLKEKSGEPIVSAFTAVNGRASPPSPHQVNGSTGMPSDTIHVRPYPPHRPEAPQEQKAPLSTREQWSSAPRRPENGAQNGHYSSVSPDLSQRDTSPNSPQKRKRSSSAEDDRSFNSPDTAPDQSRRRVESYAPVGSPPTHPGMEHAQQRTLPPMNRPEHEHWSRPQSQDMAPNGAHYRDSRTVETSPESVHPHASSPSQANGMDPQRMGERSSTTEITRAGVQVDPKKRKRQFANRTKTGCGTCRRRKKKCDEAKPECNNCSRGGFICEGYANKIPWPKNGPVKPNPPLQAKDQRYPVEPAQLYHSHGTSREPYQEPSQPGPSNEGVRGRPIVVEEHERRPPPGQNGWQWAEPPRSANPPEHSQPPEYPHSHPPPVGHPPRPQPTEPYPQHPQQQPPPPPPQQQQQGPPSQRPHNPRIYHHTPQTMSQVHNGSPGMPAEALIHQSQPSPHHHAPPAQPQGPPGPPPAHYAQLPPPRREKTEKDKMVNYEPFMPYDTALVTERDHCKKQLFQFNSGDNPRQHVTLAERQRIFRAVVEAKRMTRNDLEPFHRNAEPFVPGHVGQHVYVDIPFHCDYGYHLVIGDMVTIGPNCTFMDSGKITIGRKTRICANVTIDTQRIPKDSKSDKGSGGSVVAAEVVIGENCYIGSNVTIMGPVRIGTGAIIHPGSVVTRDVGRDVVIRGNPGNAVGVNWDD